MEQIIKYGLTFINGNSWILIALIAVITDIIIGEFPMKHPVELMGDFIKAFEKAAYKDSVFRGSILFISLVFSVLIISVSLQNLLILLQNKLNIPEFIIILALGIISSTGLASKSLKDHVKNVINSDNNKKREALSILVTRNTDLLSDKKLYGSLIETHSENLSDGVIAPLFYLLLFGFPGIMAFKAVSTLDSMVGYKNDKYEKFGKFSAIADDVLNFIPARITAVIIWILSKNKISPKKLIQEAKLYNSSPNAGFPVTAAAYNLGVQLGGPVYYGENLINKAVVGEEKTENYEQAVLNFIKVHSSADKLILLFLILTALFSIFLREFNVC